MKFQRTDRISEEIKKAISSIIMYDLKNPEVTGMISVTSVDTTSDLSYSKIFVSILGSEEQKKQTFSALKKSAGFLRKGLSGKVKLRHTPELIFELDNSIEYGMHMDKLFNEISTKEVGDKNDN